MVKERWGFWAFMVVLLGLMLTQHLLTRRVDDAEAPVRQVSKRQTGELAQRYPSLPSISQLAVAVPLSHYDRLLSRSLFAPVTAVPGAGAVVAAAPRQTRWVFRGTAQIGVQRVAVLEETISKQVTFSRQGDRLDGFTVAEVREHEVLLEQDGRVVTVGRSTEAQP